MPSNKCVKLRTNYSEHRAEPFKLKVGCLSRIRLNSRFGKAQKRLRSGAENHSAAKPQPKFTRERLNRGIESSNEDEEEISPRLARKLDYCRAELRREELLFQIAKLQNVCGKASSLRTSAFLCASALNSGSLSTASSVPIISDRFIAGIA
jgi:hypothetical protein